ncbi:uncharacterized protein GGS25DRAFT_526311 [Hypoxylon fragiforme]|uniref:uncharacterized protein n=1 Tax=Hypoxylon fragiforme TaxID=63214 RepID=UPI0020C6A60C|nr:uncharacterized protein GGS25DRAFT_526311 [Hypoxylon fragiforme]KAI2603269.1 hypothetical protein GGS25DRAFT_526311 [Hypoxylon fragiforme]
MAYQGGERRVADRQGARRPANPQPTDGLWAAHEDLHGIERFRQLIRRNAYQPITRFAGSPPLSVLSSVFNQPHNNADAPTRYGGSSTTATNSPTAEFFDENSVAGETCVDQQPWEWRQFQPNFPSRFIRPRPTSVIANLHQQQPHPPPTRPTQAQLPQADPSPSRPLPTNLHQAENHVAGTAQNVPANTGFEPMNHWTACFQGRVLPPQVLARQLADAGMSLNYAGNPYLDRNRSANIPEELSTSLWITNLPPACTHPLLLGAIKDCGKIYATVINPPENNSHTTSASKLVFFERLGADKLLMKARAGQFTVGGYVPRVRMNRIRSAPERPGPQCRVLHIEGPSHIVNETFLNAFFRTKFVYELEAVLTLATNGTNARQEWRFGSYRCQAESARQAISKEKNRLDQTEAERLAWRQVFVHFGVDPCA